MRGLVMAMAAMAATAGARAQDKEARAIVDRAVKAHGGAAALKKALAGKRSDKGKLFLEGRETTVARTVWFDLPGKMRQEITVGDRVKTTVVLSGDKAWQNDGGPTITLSPRRAKELRDEVDVLHLATLLPL